MFPSLPDPALTDLRVQAGKSDKLTAINKDNSYKEYYNAVFCSGVRAFLPHCRRYTTTTAPALGNNVPQRYPAGHAPCRSTFSGQQNDKRNKRESGVKI